MAEPADTYRAEPPGPPVATQTPVRASDADRHGIVLRLQVAVAAGQLTLGEGSQRMATAFAATHVTDLSPLIADLPSQPEWNSGPPGWRVLAWMTVEQARSLLRDALRARVMLALLLAVLLAVAVGAVTTDLFHSGAPGFGHH